MIPISSLTSTRAACLPTGSPSLHLSVAAPQWLRRKCLVGSETRGLIGIEADWCLVIACAVVPVHIHPRAHELLAVTSGRVINYMIPETGVVNANGTQRIIKTELTANMMTINPQGAFHTIYNPDCEPAAVVASFSSEDEGINAIANSFFSYNDDIIANELNQGLTGGQIDAVKEAISKRKLTIDACLKKCNTTASH